MAVEDEAFGCTAMIEIGDNTGISQFVQNVLRVAPVFKALKVVVEPMADIFVPLSHHDPTIGLGQNDCTDQTCGTSPDDFNRIVFRVGGTWR